MNARCKSLGVKKHTLAVEASFAVGLWVELARVVILQELVLSAYGCVLCIERVVVPLSYRTSRQGAKKSLNIWNAVIALRIYDVHLHTWCPPASYSVANGILFL